MTYTAVPERYDGMRYRRAGKSGLKLPLISLGLWHNFGGVDDRDNGRTMLLRAFDRGITHFDLANNYGPPPGSAEASLGRVLASDLKAHRHELVISTKAGYWMWNGPYGDGGSRKYLITSLEQSLSRLGLDHVDGLLSPPPRSRDTARGDLGALDHLVRSGKALYAGVSNYPAPLMRQAALIFKRLGTPCVLSQPKYSMLERWVEPELLSVLAEEGIGCIAFSPLAQGLLTNKYLAGVPDDSRAAKAHGFLRRDQVTDETLARVRQLDAIARRRGQTLAQLALVWVLRHPGMTSALIGASRVSQIEDAVGALAKLELSGDELAESSASSASDGAGDERPTRA